MSFKELGLSPELLQVIEDAGYTEPTPIQREAIPHALAGRDILGVAQTGTGKTASFTLPMIDRLAQGRAKARMPRTLILEPTRELAAQVAENFEKYGKRHKLTMALLIGGVSFGDQDRLLTQGVDVLIATPGRLLDHFERGKLLLNGVQVMVVDEADRMLDMGFIPDIERIFKLTPFTRQTLFFSATMPPEIQRLTNQFLQNPIRIEVERKATAAETVTQRIVRIGSSTPKDKRAALRKAIDSCTINTAIVFCNRKRDVDVVARSLQRHGYKASPIHGDLPQSVRTATLDSFRRGEINLLVASDVAARGLDIPDVSQVFNFDVPRHPEDYIHRIGRTGRAGRSGESFTIVTPEDRKSLAAVEHMLGTKIVEVGATAPAKAAATAEKPAETAERRPERADSPAPAAAAAETAKPPRRDSRKTERPKNAERPPEKKADRPEPAPRPARDKAPAPKDEPRGGRRGPKPDKPEPGDRGGRTVGLGDHTPAFLLKPVPAGGRES